MRASRLKIDLSFGVALVLLGISALLAFRSVNELRSSQGLITHTERVLREIATVHANIYMAETSQRGYILTGQDVFLTPYANARSSIAEGLLSLESLLASDPTQSAEVRRLRDLTARRLAALQDAIDFARRGQTDQAITLVREGPGRDLMDSISVAARQLMEDEFAVLERRRTEESATAGGTILFVLTGGVAAILIVATSRRSLLRELARRERAEGRLEQNSRYLRELYGIAASHDLSIQAKLGALVALGAARFDVRLGVLLHEHAGLYHVVAVHDPAGAVQLDEIVPPDDPCLAVLPPEDGSISSEPPPPDGSVCFGSIPVRTALMMALDRQGDRAVLAFLDPAAPETPFTDLDRDFLRLIAQWIESEVDRYRVSEELSRREERYRGLVESASDLIFTLDLHARFTYVNPVAAQALGLPQDSLVGRPAFELVREDVREDLLARLSDQIERRVTQRYYEVPVITPDGRELWLGHNVQLLMEDGGPTGMQSVARDITRQREVERMKDEFLSVVSHELRTPLTAIRGSLGLLASGRLGQLEQQGQRMLEIAAQNTDRLVRLINDLLDIDKIASGKAPLQKRPTDLESVISEALEPMQAMAEREGVSLVRRTEPVTAVVDRDRMHQVLTNLLSNAIKFSGSGSTVTVTAGRRGDHAVVSVTDQGRGIPADKLQSIFERFQQVDSSDSRQKGGTGLGLAIVRQIVEQHGGSVTVQSEWGVGSTFTFIVPVGPLPVETTPVSEVPRTERTSAVASACEVLIIEDDIDLARVIAEMLRERGISSRIAGDGVDALEMSETADFDLLLLDPGLPRMDGFQLVERLRQDERYRSAPLVVYTTRDLGPAERNALRLGATEFLTKSRHPLNLLEARVASLLASTGADRAKT